ncbi:MAG: carboxy terminal-processing peptidase [Limisphaerales bacterium]
MSRRFALKISALTLLAVLTAWLPFGRLAAKSTDTKAAPATNSMTATNPAPLAPGANDGRIAYVTARLMEEYHYLQQPLDEKTSERFFDNYLEDLDPRRENFLATDIAGFEHYRTNLNKLTVTERGRADLTPAFEIFQCFLERLQQHDAYVDTLLKQDKFKFDKDERYLVDRRDAPRPQNLEEAKQLWKQRLRYEYLQEKLNFEQSRTNEAASSVLSLPKSAVTNITETLARRYNRILHKYTSWDSTDVLQSYLTALTHAYDPHSDYLNTEHAQDFSINMNLSLFGIGAGLESVDGNCYIKSLIPGGPAAKSNLLKEKDKIIAVAQGKDAPVDVVDMEINKVVQLIRGAKGTEVRLTIVPTDNPTTRRVVTLIRDEIKLEDQAAKARLIELSDGHGGTNRLGVISLPSFYANIDLPGNLGRSSAKTTTTDVSLLIKKLEEEKVAGIVLDLRFNPGGSLEEAVKLTGLFITNGPVVLVRSPEGRVLTDSDDDSSVLYNGPLTVLINRFSASASEIVAAALQDYGRAIVIGDTSTHGKGTVQNLSPLRPFVWPTSLATNDPGTAKITIRKFYRVSGASTQLRGVTPDIVLPDILSYLTTIGEPSLENPLPWDTIPRAIYDKLDLKYDKLNLVQPYLADLTKHSDSRIATNQEFAYIQQDIAQFVKSQADKTVTLNEREALKEREKNDALKKMRDAEIKSRKLPDMKIYEITMRNVSDPGLPPPLGATNNVVTAGTNSTRTASTIAGTNSPPDATSTATSSVDADDDIFNKPSLDPVLAETTHILEDYIALLAKSNTLIANQ